MTRLKKELGEWQIPLPNDLATLRWRNGMEAARVRYYPSVRAQYELDLDYGSDPGELFHWCIWHEDAGAEPSKEGWSDTFEEGMEAAENALQKRR